MNLFQRCGIFMLIVLGAFKLPQAASSPISFCPDDPDVCLQWAVSDVRDPRSIYFQINATRSYQWIGLGIGTQMAGATMFILYEDGNGNVTVSHREASGHSMPRVAEENSIILLDDSGVRDSRMVANVRYDVPTGFDFSASTDWIMATKQGSSIASVELDEPIGYHDSHDAFSVELLQAVLSLESLGSNPFGGSNSDSEDNGPPPSGGVTEKASRSSDKLNLAHGIVLAIVFLVLYPIGSLIMPLLGKWYIHAAWQMIAFLIMWAGFGIGYVVSRRLDMFFSNTHTRFGVILVGLLSVQTVLGVFHHLQYRRQGARGVYGHVHMWYGRALIVLGMVNGGLGMQLTGASKVYIIVYSIAAGISALSYASYSALQSWRSMKRRKA